jgi:hypothetical protein
MGKSKAERAYEHFNALLERAAQHDIDSIPVGLKALVSVHVFGNKVTRPAKSAAPAASCKYYSGGDSVLVPARDIKKMTPAAASIIAAALWLTDFKWLDGSCRTGFGTRVHFGYGDMYGNQPIRFPIPISISSGTLAYTQSEKKVIMKIKSVEVPLDKNNYIFVKGLAA